MGPRIGRLDRRLMRKPSLVRKLYQVDISDYINYIYYYLISRPWLVIFYLCVVTFHPSRDDANDEGFLAEKTVKQQVLSRPRRES